MSIIRIKFYDGNQVNGSGGEFQYTGTSPFVLQEREMSEIPAKLFEKFKATMDANNDEDLADGAWWARLEGAAYAFIRKHRLKADETDAVHQYLNSLPDRQSGEGKE